MNSVHLRYALRGSSRKCRSHAKSPRPICFQSPTLPEIMYPSLPMAGLTLQFHSFDAKYVMDLCAGDFKTQERC
jgi:hypothetical protein